MSSLDPSVSPNDLAERLIETAWNLYRLSRYDQAIEMGERALAVEPGSGRARRVIAFCFAMKSQYKQAIQWALEAAGADPDNAWSHYAVSFTFFYDPRWREEVSAGFLAELDMHTPNRQRQIDDAFAACAEAMRLDPEEAEFHLHQARMYARLKKQALALESVEIALRHAPESAEAQAVRAEAMLALGRNPDALLAAGKAIAADPEAINAHVARGRVLLAGGDIPAARSHFLEAVRLDPTSEYVKAGYLDALRHGVPVYRRWVRHLEPRSGPGDAIRAATLPLAIGFFVLLTYLSGLLGPVEELVKPTPRLTLAAVLILSGAGLVAFLSATLGKLLVDWVLLRDPVARSMITRGHVIRVYLAAAAVAALTLLGVAMTVAALWQASR